MITVFAISASAQRNDGRIESQRIEKGFNSGALTRPERSHLRQQEFRYKNEKRRAFRDGRINRHERRRLQRMKRHERREIFRLKHNGRRRVM
jgi:hypothetical protein